MSNPDSPPNLFYIPPGVAFMPVVAKFLHNQLTEMRIFPADVRLFLPNFAAAQAFKNAFATQHDEPVTLLPQIRLLGEVSEQEDIFAADERPNSLFQNVISVSARSNIFAALTKQAFTATGQKIGVGQALSIASELTQLLDSASLEEISPWKRTETLLPGQSHGKLAAHHEQLKRLIDIIGRFWPGYLAEQNAVDPQQALVTQYHQFREQLRLAPPPMVILAGSTGMAPASEH